MRRISSLPTSEFCSRVDKIGQDVASTQAERSTVFHEYCDTGKWPEGLRSLPEADREEIGNWRVPMPFVYKVGSNVTHALQYREAIRESRVALDSSFNYVDVPPEVAQDDIANLYPQVMIVGHLDMAWVVGDLVIICDIKSSIFAVPERCESLQLHGYGLALAVKLNKPRYLTAIWDASDAQYYVNPNGPVELDGFEAEVIRDRIRLAASERDGGFRVGEHCSGCWKRSRCPAHLVDVPEGEFKAILSGQATQKDVRQAIIKLKQQKDLVKEVEKSVKSWVDQHGPVISEDGKKHYRCELRSGKLSTDYDRIARELGVKDLDGFKKRGNDYQEYAWRKRD